jgi:hypothetical protein
MVAYQKARASPFKCNSYEFNKFQLLPFSTQNSNLKFTNLIFNQSNFEDYPCCYSGGNNCAQVKIRLNAKPCCPPSEQGLYERINDLESAQGYECQTGFSCQRVEWQTVECDGPDGNPYVCGVNPTGFACGSPPTPTPTATPTPTPSCTPTGHEEGAEGYEYECNDTDPETGKPKDNDCNGKANCRESRCGATQQCQNECDKDQDEFIARECGGNDCRDTDPIIPLKDALTRALIAEAGGRFCENGEDDDCDDLIDDADPDCNGQPTPTPTPCPCDDCDLGCPPGGGDEYPRNYSYYCYSSYMVTTYWISYDNGETWSYLLETWDYVGSYCTVIQ